MQLHACEHPCHGSPLAAVLLIDEFFPSSAQHQCVGSPGQVGPHARCNLVAWLTGKDPGLLRKKSAGIPLPYNVSAGNHKQARHHWNGTLALETTKADVANSLSQPDRSVA